MGENEPGQIDLDGGGVNEGVRSDTPWGDANKPETHRMRTLISLLVGTGVLVVLWFIGAAVLPRWWAQRIGNIVDGGLTAGSLLGLIIGAVFTLLPVLVLYLAWRFRGGWRRWLVMVVVAAFAAAPNLLTLGIVLGSGNAAHAGERILDVDGPGFRGASLLGAVLGAAVGFLLVWLLAAGRRSRRKAKKLEAELEAQSLE